MTAVTNFSPSDPPLLKRSGGVSKWGEENVEAVSKCRSDVSKRRFAWGFPRAEDVEAVEARPRRVSKFMSKRCRSGPTSTGKREAVGVASFEGPESKSRSSPFRGLDLLDLD